MEILPTAEELSKLFSKIKISNLGHALDADTSTRFLVTDGSSATIAIIPLDRGL